MTLKLYKPSEDSGLPIPCNLTHHYHPVFAVSASLESVQREDMASLDMDGWVLEPIEFMQTNVILKCITKPERRRQEAWEPGLNWKYGGWLLTSPTPVLSLPALRGEDADIPTPPEELKAGQSKS